MTFTQARQCECPGRAVGIEHHGQFARGRSSTQQFNEDTFRVGMGVFSQSSHEASLPQSAPNGKGRRAKRGLKF